GDRDGRVPPVALRQQLVRVDGGEEGEVAGVEEAAVAEPAAELAEPVGLLGEPGVDGGEVGELERGAGVGAPPALLVVAGAAELVEPELDVLERGRRAADAVAHAEDDGGDPLDGGVAAD